jgi:hypothetical protein
MTVNDARKRVDKLVAAGRPLQEIEEYIDQAPISKDAKTFLWLRACRRRRAEREMAEGLRHRQLGDEEWLSSSAAG